jgi:ribosome-associated protein
LERLEQSKEIVKIVYKALENKKAEDIRVLDIHQISSISDYFIIATGNNTRQVQTLADEVQYLLGQGEYKLINCEGYQTARWILLDYGVVVVHIFYKEDRDFYNLERLWSDAVEVSIDED